jgi:hypothetical protein
MKKPITLRPEYQPPTRTAALAALAHIGLTLQDLQTYRDIYYGPLRQDPKNLDLYLTQANFPKTKWSKLHSLNLQQRLLRIQDQHPRVQVVDQHSNPMPLSLVSSFPDIRCPFRSLDQADPELFFFIEMEN